MKNIDLSGNWSFRTDEEDLGTEKGFFKECFRSEPFFLPGSACDNKVGKKTEYYEEYSREAVRAPRERYEYIGPLWLQRTVEIPEDFCEKAVCLFLERVNIASRLWVDDEEIGRQIIELCGPHVYDLSGKLTPGVHRITLRIDNRNLVGMDGMASGYSVDTQGFWTGILGRMELICREVFHLDQIQIYPEEKGILVKAAVTSDVYSPLQRAMGCLELQVETPDGSLLPVVKKEVELYNSIQNEYLYYEIPDIRWWDEFHPELYSLRVRYLCLSKARKMEEIQAYRNALPISEEQQEQSFGMRVVKRQGKEICLNKKGISLRGTTNCAIFPLTGYPEMGEAYWREMFALIKRHGLNHVRFHAWCPPKSAFTAADHLGVYLSVEMPLWLNRDVCALELGEDPVHRSFYHQEAETISRVYGNHPSFLMFSNGNENMGDFSLLEDITTQIKAWDNRRIYTLTTNFDHPIMPCEDYLCAFEASGHKIRIQDLHDLVEKDTCLDYEQAVEDTPVPIISFEMGQYCVYPDVAGIRKYTGNMLPVNLDVIQKEMEKKGVSDRLSQYIQASGDLAAKLYKEDIEAVLRTKRMGGFELLSLYDYTGQNTATIGMLDAFGDSKGIITPEEFAAFAGPVVPLFKAKRVYRSGEILEAELELYDYGETKIQEPEFCLELYNGTQKLASVTTREKKVQLPLDMVSEPALVDVILRVKEYKNSWRIFVYPDGKDAELTSVSSQKELKEAIQKGGPVLVSGEGLKNPVEGSFVPVFWSPAFFPSQKPCGAMIQEMHPVFREFPTGHYLDYQWKPLLDGSRCMDISGLQLSPLVELVPNFVDNTPASPLFEAQAGKAKILFCGFDLNKTDPCTTQFKRSLYAYLASPEFHPVCTLKEEELLEKFV